MSIKHAVLALLRDEPAHGYRLRSEFEERTGRSWPLNIGQIYTTLARLERDGLVEVAVDEAGAQDEGDDTSKIPFQDAAQGSANHDGSVTAAPAARQVSYRATEGGRSEVAVWFATPVSRSQPPRDEVAIKLAIAVTLPDVDIGTLIARQRSETMASLTHYTHLKGISRAISPQEPADVAASLALDRLLFATQAELQWLEHCEARLTAFLTDA